MRQWRAEEGECERMPVALNAARAHHAAMCNPAWRIVGVIQIGFRV